MISIFCLILTLNFSGHAKAPQIASAKTEQTKLIEEIDKKYQNAEAITMSVGKTDKMAALDQTREFAGTLIMKKGKFRLELQTKDKNKDTSLVVADGNNFWLVTPPPKEFQDAKTQVFKASMSDKRAKAQGLLQILTQGGVLKYFKVTGVSVDGDKVTYFLQPSSKGMEMRRLQVVADKQNKVIDSLKYWDTMDNETYYQFTNIDFEKSIRDELLSYKPPKDADVMNY
jgi:outer membrane lipoprotein-sorting protein